MLFLLLQSSGRARSGHPRIHRPAIIRLISLYKQTYRGVNAFKATVRIRLRLKEGA